VTAACVVLLFLAPMTRAAPEEQGRGQFIPYLQAQRIELVDETGAVRGRWVAGNEETSLELVRPDGRAAASWASRDTSTALIFTIPNERGPALGPVGLALLQTADQAAVHLASDAGEGRSTVRAGMILGTGDEPSLVLTRSDGSTLRIRPCAADGTLSVSTPTNREC
jgi:hypothetical protein